MKIEASRRRPVAGTRAVRVLAWWEIRRHWRSTVALALLVGAVGAIVTATIAGARRSDSALGRFNEYSHSADIEMSIGESSANQLAAFRASPGVAAASLARAYALNPVGAPNVAINAPLDGAMGNSVDRALVVEGRRADPSAPNEVTLGEALAAQLRARPGSSLATTSYTPAQIETLFSGGEPGPPAGPRVRFRVAGIVRLPLDLGDRATDGGIVFTTRAFNERYAKQIGVYGEGLRVRTTAGAVDVPRVVAAARRLWGENLEFDPQGLGIETEGPRNAISVLTRALLIFAGVTGLAGIVAIGIVLTRSITTAQLDQSTLRALGFTRRERVAMSGPRALLIAGGGALLAGFGAVVASPLLPVGIARRADPDLGLHADSTVLALAVPLIAMLTLAIAFVAARRATRRSAFEAEPRSARRRGTVAALATAAGMRPTATNGLRMALESGSGETAIPVRSAFGGAVLGVAGIVVVLMFAANLAHLVDTPRLYGWTFDVTGEVPSSKGCNDPRDFGLANEPGVEAVAGICHVNIQIEGRPVTAWAFHSLKNVIDPQVVAGRAPRGPSEVALGAVTLDAVGRRIGDTVRATGAAATRTYKIVGRIVLPRIAQPQPLADGASFTGAGLTPILDPDGPNFWHYRVARVAPGTDRAALERRIASLPAVVDAGRVSIPKEVEHLQQIGWLPTSLTVLLGTLALLAVGHALVTAVRRRRRELALLKIVGFDRRQVRATVAWQATTIGIIGLVIGIPIGVAVGRVVWRLVAEGLGVATNVTIPVVAVALIIPSTLALVNLIAFLPARAAAEIRPAVAMRSE